MKRPVVSIENRQEVFAYYDQRGPNRPFAKFGHWAMSKKFPSNEHYAAGSRDQIAEAVANDALCVMLFNHVNDQDQFFMAGTAHRIGALAPRLGNFVIMAEPKLFSMETPAKKARRMAIDGLGSFPGFRAKDGQGEKGSAERVSQREASDMSVGLTNNKVNRDHHDLALFPEAERAEPIGADPKIVRPFKRGLRDIYEAIEDPNRQVCTVMAGIYYGEGEDRSLQRPTIYVGNPLVGRMQDGSEYSQTAQDMLQQYLDIAVDLRKVT